MWLLPSVLAESTWENIERWKRNGKTSTMSKGIKTKKFRSGVTGDECGVKSSRMVVQCKGVWWQLQHSPHWSAWLDFDLLHTSQPVFCWHTWEGADDNPTTWPPATLVGEAGGVPGSTPAAADGPTAKYWTEDSCLFPILPLSLSLCLVNKQITKSVLKKKNKKKMEVNIWFFFMPKFLTGKKEICLYSYN